MSSTDYDYLAKIIVVGNGGVGTSSISSVIADHGFLHDYNMTIGVDFFAVRRNIGNIKWKMHLWDTAGQESFKSITRTYYREAAISLLVFDLSQRDTFYNIYKWKKDVERENSNTYFVLIGNKKDLKRKVTTSEAQEWATNNNMLYFETSAKNNEVNIFNSILSDFDKKRDKNNNNGVTPNVNMKKIPKIQKDRICCDHKTMENNSYCCEIQ